ncbi:Hyaluronoglucosaminidase 3, partial [Halocaridina rubra]
MRRADDYASRTMMKIEDEVSENKNSKAKLDGLCKRRCVAVLDFENYYPSYNMNLPEYREESRRWVSSQHPSWSPDQVEEEAMRTFNTSAREFFEVLLWVGRELRPLAKWGYYHYPYCHNYGPDGKQCQEAVKQYNDEMSWLYGASGALYPSIYIFRDSGWTPRSRRRNAQVKLWEALR